MDPEVQHRLELLEAAVASLSRQLEGLSLAIAARLDQYDTAIVHLTNGTKP